MKRIFLLNLILMFCVVSLDAKISKTKAIQSTKKIYSTSTAEIDAKTQIPISLFNIKKGPYSGTSVEIAKTYLKENINTFKMKTDLSDLSNIKLQQSFGISHVNFYQSVNDVPVFRSDVVVSIDRNNFVTFVTNNYKPNLEVSTIPSLTNQTAIEIAKENLNAKKIVGDTKSQLMIYAENETPQLAYKINLFCEEPLGDWEIFVNAIDGKIISVEDIAMYETRKKVTGSGFVWNPDPLTSSNQYYGTTGFIDPNGNDTDTPELNDQRILVPLQDITFSNEKYKLEGPHCKLSNFESPTDVFANPSSPDSFQFTRSQQGFEEVMVYFWIDSSQRYIQSLGFDSIQNLPIECDPHGLNGADNSHYIPSQNRLAWGEGGSDDDEDLDVIWHEYGHAIHNGIKPGWGGNEAGHLGEGFGDYWAGSYSRSINSNFNISSDKVFTWDAGFTVNGSGTFWDGRTLVDTRNYPPNGVSGMGVHDAGQIWSGALMLIWNDIGRDVLDKLVLKSHYYLSTSPTMRQNAQAVIQADRDLFGGIHLQQIVQHFGERNFVNPNDYVPQIQHTKLNDTEDLFGPYHIIAKILPGLAPLDSSSLKLIFGRGFEFTDTVQLIPTEIPSEFACDILGNGVSTNYRYYISASDINGTVVTSPANAPNMFYSFYVGFDTVLPTIIHNPLRDISLSRYPVNVGARATDNLGIDLVWVEYYKNFPAFSGTFTLENVEGNNYLAAFNIPISELQIGDSIFYKVVARDISTNQNISVFPEIGFNKFTIIETSGNVLIIDDDTANAFQKIMTEKGISEYKKAVDGSKSPNLFYTTLTELGYDVTFTKIADLDISMLSDYGVIIASSGITLDPLRREDLRDALVELALNGNKILIEGGEVGYDFRKSSTSDIDINFRQNVLHDSSWSADNGAGSITFFMPEHPIFTYPNTLFEPISFTTRHSYTDKDAMKLNPNDVLTYRAGNWSEETEDASIIVFGEDIEIPQIVFFAFAVGSITDSLTAKGLIENTITFLNGIVSVNENQNVKIPTKFSLKQNYPNPFNPKTKIKYEIAKSGFVNLKVFDVLGREIKTLVNENKNVGVYETEFDANNLNSGMYFYKLTTNNFSEMKKMILVK